MRHGDWDVVEGAYFSEWSKDQHVVAPFAVPSHWLRFRSGDWGSASPFSIGWWAVVGDDHLLPRVSGRSLVLPRGALIRYRELYGKKGLKLTAEQLGAKIVEAEKSDPKLSYGVLDPSAFKEDGGPSLAERINGVLGKTRLIGFHEADNARVPKSDGADRGGPIGGWDQMRARLVGSAQKDNDGVMQWSTGRPMIYTFATCHDSIRTIPVLQHDPHRAEDLDTKAEDHAADDWRYACMSRPWVKSLPKDAIEKRDAFREARDERYSDEIATL